MEQSDRSKKVLLSVIGVAILVVAVVGVSFAFFNYTRTGSPNQVGTGTIHFNSTQSLNNVTNVFPISKATAQAATSASHANVTYAEVTISGNTNFNAGLDFRITARDVDLKGVPVSVLVEHPTTGAALTVVNSAASAATGNSIYIANFEGGTLQNSSVLAVGHINANTNVTSEKIIIKAYLDDSAIFITDTPANGPYDPEQSAESGYAANSNDSNSSNGTTVPGGKTAITTSDWNALASTPATFKIRVESHETGSGSYMD